MMKMKSILYDWPYREKLKLNAHKGLIKAKNNYRTQSNTQNPFQNSYNNPVVTPSTWPSGINIPECSGNSTGQTGKLDL